MKKAFRIFTRVFLVVLPIGVMAWYGLVQFIQYNLITNQNFLGESLSDAVLIGIGDDVFFEDKAVQNPVRSEIKEECRGYDTIQECLGISAWHDAAATAYYRQCGFLWSQQCAVFAMNDKILAHENWRELLGRIVKAPCQYFPTKEEAELRKERYEKDGIKNKEEFPNIHLHYMEAREDIGCDIGMLTFRKVIIAIYNVNNKKYIDSIVFQIQ